MGICVLTSSNSLTVPLTPDPWYSMPYPRGLFQTSCSIPGDFLNDGLYSITVYVNISVKRGGIFSIRDVLTFNVQDTGKMRAEYTGTWIGVVRPRLEWQTVQLGA